jgi:hypothetical protein
MQQRIAWKMGVALVVTLGLLACDKAEPTRAEPTKAEPTKEEPAKLAEPVKEEPAKAEPAKEEPKAVAKPSGVVLPSPDFSLKTPSLKAPNNGGKNLLGEDKKKPSLLGTDPKAQE